MHRKRLVWVLALMSSAALAHAQEGASAPEHGEATDVTPQEEAADPNEDEAADLDEEAVAEFSSTVMATRSRRSIVSDHRAVTVIDAQELAERAPRTTPEALHMVPGVSVQRTNYGGGSPYLRGRTGQQTLILIDGFRLNTSIMRSGPNQYLNTVDPDALDRIEVLRGAGSVLYGSDAIGGVVGLMTREPGADTSAAARLRGATADRSLSGRGEVGAVVGPARVVLGAGGSRYGDLRGAGPPPLATVPVYDGDVQRFTGYDEVAADAKVAVPVGGRGEITAAAIGYHQLGAPRTDKCSAEPLDCRYFDQQFYDVGYVRYRGDAGPLYDIDAGAMAALTHERRRRVRAASDRIDHELDQVLTVGLTGRASAPTRHLGDASLRLSGGAELYHDVLLSEASRETASTGELTAEARGKYLDGSRYLTAAGFVFGELRLTRELSATAGLRAQLVRAAVAADPETARDAFTQTALVPVASAGVRLGLTDHVHLVANADQGFRAPNLDDLTARSSEGPGFQLANPELEPERSVTLEGGVQVSHPRLAGAVYAYQTFIDGFIARDPAECPPELAERCGDAEHVFVLTNAAGARIHGVEAAARVQLPAGVSLVGSATWTVASRVVTDQPDVPESKIPPLHGRFGVRFDGGKGRYFLETTSYWALRQDRLSPADEADARIPPGGTPGYGAVDLRLGAHLGGRLRGTLHLENLTDTAYRVHGSGIDGPGFGAVMSLSATL